MQFQEQTYNFLQCNYMVEDTEGYLHKIVSSKYNDTDALLIYKALANARQAHGAQRRGDTAPFIIHPMRVALMLVELDRNITSKVFIAALLHDTLEDTSLTSLEIEEQFGKYVAKLVRAVTTRCDTEDLQEKREAKRQKWEELMQGCHEARAIKTFEDLDNMMCWKAIPEESPAHRRIPRWLVEAKEMSLPLAHATNLQAYKLMKQEYMYYVEHARATQLRSI